MGPHDPEVTLQVISASVALIPKCERKVGQDCGTAPMVTARVTSSEPGG